MCQGEYNNMDYFKISHLIVFLSFVINSSSTNVCDVENRVSNCMYTVVCKTYAGSATNPTCSSEPNVTFTISGSNVDTLTTGFFGSTNFDSRVRFLKAINNNWMKLESMTFRYYSRAVYMDLSNNKIQEIKNEVFKNLVNLEYLNLSSNAIDILQPKAFLASDSKSSSLKVLDLSYNILMELTGNEISPLLNLKILYLQGNRLQFLSDDCFSNLKLLSVLNLHHNILSSLNMTLIHLKAMTDLDLSHNHITKLSGYELNRLVGLENLNASHNAIRSVESNCFNLAFNLRVVDFSFNSIQSGIESVMFINNIKLGYLDFYNNHVPSIHENSFKHNALYYINFENNNITGDILENTLVGLQNITKLDLSKQSITAVRNKSFSEMQRLLFLNLSRNSINVIEYSSFVNISINVLDVSYNKVSKLNFFNDCLTNLTKLYLNNNDITAVQKNTFQNQTFLKVLDISMNKILIIEQYSLPLKELQYLNISKNRLTGVIKEKTFSPSKYLRSLDLSNFNITQIHDMAFINLPVLARLNLSHNQIEFIQPNNFKGVDNMYSLDVSYNYLTRLEFNSSVVINLQALYLNNNNLTNITDIFKSTCKLRYLDMSNNKVSNLSVIGANIFPNLSVLHLSHNAITSFNNPQTNSLITLVDLRLSSNNLTDIQLKYFKELMSVDLSNNSFTYINSTFFENVEYIQALDMSNNKITELPPGTFQNMRNLKLLNLSSNYVTNLRYGSLKGLHMTEFLDISKNRLTSIDVDVFHECSKLNTLIIDYNYIKTFDVEGLINRYAFNLKTLSLGGNPISCREIVNSVRSVRVNRVEVTAVDKIYHDDNVHGIKCGNVTVPITTTETTKMEKIESTSLSEYSTSTIILIWCSIITVLMVIAGVVTYVKLCRNGRVFAISQSRLRGSLEINGTEFQSDLLN